MAELPCKSRVYILDTENHLLRVKLTLCGGVLVKATVEAPVAGDDGVLLWATVFDYEYSPPELEMLTIEAPLLVTVTGREAGDFAMALLAKIMSGGSLVAEYTEPAKYIIVEVLGGGGNGADGG